MNIGEAGLRVTHFAAGSRIFLLSRVMATRQHRIRVLLFRSSIREF